MDKAVSYAPFDLFAAGLIEHSVSCSALISRDISHDNGDVTHSDAGNAPEVQNVANNTNKLDNTVTEDSGKTNKLGHTIIEGEVYKPRLFMIRPGNRCQDCIKIQLLVFPRLFYLCSTIVTVLHKDVSGLPHP